MFVPGLLMLAAFGLEHVENRLGGRSAEAAELAEFLALAQPLDVTRMARDGMSEAMDCFQRRQARPATHREPVNHSHAFPKYVHAGSIPQFRQTEHADSV